MNSILAKSEKDRMQWMSICIASVGCLMMTVSVIGLAML